MAGGFGIKVPDALARRSCWRCCEWVWGVTVRTSCRSRCGWAVGGAGILGPDACMHVWAAVNEVEEWCGVLASRCWGPQVRQAGVNGRMLLTSLVHWCSKPVVELAAVIDEMMLDGTADKWHGGADVTVLSRCQRRDIICICWCLQNGHDTTDWH